VIDALLHAPVVLARRFATLDQFSGGRVVAVMRASWGPDPVAFSPDVVPALATTFREAAREAGRDPAGLTVVARANVPITRDPLGEGRPFLGGSPGQIAGDLARLEAAGAGN
jgi:alkanesulfonate monooxygenase SsuD/methylene tetrahydromethanopterin reductase-like flavin-dependent oxidoreductase (luciferase family)